MDQKNKGIWFALIVLFLINTVNFFDRLIIGAVGEPIRKEFGLSDASLGFLSTAFTLIYAVAGIPLGRLADKISRKKILSAGVFIWSLLTAGSGLAQNYWQIFAMRIGVGVGEASCAPAAVSLIGDMFPAERRARALSIFMLGLPIGIALSFAVSGSIAQAYGWRAAFLFAGVPGILLAVLALFIREPVRAGTQAPSLHDCEARAVSPQAAMPTRVSAFRRSVYRSILSSPTMRWLIISGAIHNFCLYALSSFMTPYLMRFHGMEIRDAGLISMIINGILTLPGLLLGGFVGDAVKKSRANGAMIVVTLATLLSIPFFIFALAAPAGSIYVFLIMMGAAFALMYFYYAIVYSTIADVTEPNSRGTAMSLYFFAMYVFGGAFGPYIVGLVSDHFTKQAAIAAGVVELSTAALEPFRASGLRSAVYIVPVLVVLLTGVLFAASRTVKVEMEKLKIRNSPPRHKEH